MGRYIYTRIITKTAFVAAIILAFAFLGSCSDGEMPESDSPVILNPYDYAPLAAGLEIPPITEDLPVYVEIAAQGEGSEDYRYDLILEASDEPQFIPILGLYPDAENRVLLRYGKESREYVVNTGPLPEKLKLLEKIEVEGSYEGPEMTFFQYFTSFSITGGIQYTNVSVAVDKQGKIRWYSAFPSDIMGGVLVIDGLIYAAGKGSNADYLFVYDFLGKELERWDLSKLDPHNEWTNAHHDVIKRPNGNLIITVNLKDDETEEHWLIEFDPDTRQTIKVVNRWDLEEVFPNVDELFIDLPHSYYAKPDVVHNNGICLAPNGNIIASSQRMGLAEVDSAGFPVWFFSPHVVKDMVPAAGHFPALDYSVNPSYELLLLDPLDAAGNQITDPDVLNGLIDHPDFSYPWRQHTPIILDNRYLAVFDNRWTTNFKTTIDKSDYSRMVIYEIGYDTDTSDGESFGGTVRQVWDYALAEDWSALSITAGDVSEAPNGNLTVTYGALGIAMAASESGKEPVDGTLMGKLKAALYMNTNPKKAVIVEIVPFETPYGEYLFRMDIPAPKDGGLTTYRSHRINLAEGFKG